MRDSGQWTRRVLGTVFAAFAAAVVLGALSGVGTADAQADASAQKADFVGAASCVECHQDKEDKFKNGVHGKAWPKAKDIPFEKSCETCHGPGSLHAEAAGDKENPGFFSIISAKRAAKQLEQSCLECHKGGDRLHWGGSSHDSRDVSCLSCHSMHSAKSKKNQLAKANEMETCFECHKQRKVQFQRSSHMPLHEGKMSCTDCHNPHGGKGPANLRQATASENCLSCHTEKRGPFLWEHAPVREDCMNCHEPHGSQHDKLLKAKRPRLCQECHIESRHPTTAGSTGSLRLAGRSCTECHSQIHGSNHPSGVRFIR